MMTSRTHDEIRAELSARRAALVERAARVDRDLSRKNEPLSADFSDQAIQVQNDETLEVIQRAAREEIASIDEALNRLNLNLYGICDQCGERIPESRLRVAPSATRCATCTEIRNPE